MSFQDRERGRRVDSIWAGETSISTSEAGKETLLNIAKYC
jgi:hypothetical protein